MVHPVLGARDIRVNTAPMTNEQGELIGAAITLQDIHSDLDNRRKLEQFRTIADSTSDIIGVGSFRPHADYLNPAGRSFFGTERISLARDSRRRPTRVPPPAVPRRGRRHS